MWNYHAILTEVTAGTQIEREVLVLLIERGLIAQELEPIETLCPRLGFHPNEQEPIFYTVHPLFLTCWFGINTTGIAFLGLKGKTAYLMNSYREQWFRMQSTKIPASKKSYAAVADMLGLPLDLLWEAQVLEHLQLLGSKKS